MTSRVFVASLPTRYDVATGEDVPSLDLNPALKHGELVILTKGPKATGKELTDAMGFVADTIYYSEPSDYDYDAGDCILMVGDPILNAVAISAALDAGARELQHNSKPVTVLRWDRKKHQYDKVEITS